MLLFLLGLLVGGIITALGLAYYFSNMVAKKAESSEDRDAL